MMDMYNEVSIRFRELVVLFVMRMIILVSLIAHSSRQRTQAALNEITFGTCTT
jgi:hypothetical protein